MKPSRRRYRARRLDEALRPMLEGLLSEGSKSTHHFKSTLFTKLRTRVTGRFNGMPPYTDYEQRALYWHIHNIDRLINKAINTTDTYKKARLKLWKMIDIIILEYQLELEKVA